jgi:ferredoxin-like protein FixX
MAQNQKEGKYTELTKEERKMPKAEVDLRKLVKRVPVSSDFIHHNKDRCTGCGKCVKICPMDLWELRKGKAEVSRNYAEKCLECGSCWLVCKFDAIDFSYPKGGTGVTWEYG